MKGGNRKFCRPGILHVYQRALDKGIIFYTAIDRLVYLSIASVESRKLGVRILAMAIMFSHIHQSCASDSKEVISKYIQDTSSIFARMHNNEYGQHGSLFARPFGSSLKRTAKEIRSNLAYVNNNHTEKGLCTNAVEARWNLLAYRRSRHPFSEPLGRQASQALTQAISWINAAASKNKYLTYKLLHKAFKGLSDQEQEQLIDYIISSYPVVDYESAEGFFGGFEQMLTAFDSNTGNEYALREEYTSAPDIAYVQLTSFAAKRSLINVENPPLLRLPLEKRYQIARDCFEKTAARKFQICKFLHLPDSTENT